MVSPDRLNIVCIKVGQKYGSEYVNILYASIKRNLTLPFKFYCLTDNPIDLHPKIECISAVIGLEGWWQKLALFHSGLMPRGQLLYLDLDLIILGNLDSIFCNLDSMPFTCLRDWIDWNGHALNSSIMTFDPMDFSFVWDNFYPRCVEIQRDYAALTDQGYLDEVIPSTFERFYINNSFPHSIKSYKFSDASLVVPLDSRICIVDCHGSPKPHELLHLDWVKSHWRE